MENISVFQLIAPSICLAFAVTFTCIFLYNRNRIAPLFFALSYFAGGLGLSVDILRDLAENFRISYLSNTLYITSASLLVVAFAKHYRSEAPAKTIGFLALATLVIFTWFFEVQDSMTIRTVLMNVSAALIFGLTLRIIPHKDCHFIDRILFWVMVISVAQFFVRTYLVFFVTGETLTAESYSGSAFSKSFHFVMTINSMVLAITLCIAMGVEAILDYQRLSQTDALSGLINRRGFEEEASAAIQRCRGNGTPLSLIVCDIDHFKAVNDTYGHAVGDWVIKEFGTILTERCRYSDSVGRIGGEEFCILLPNANVDMAKLVAQACRVGFAHRRFKNVPHDARFTASFGAAEMRDGESYQELFQRADAALYQAKQSGRNRVVTAKDESITTPIQTEPVSVKKQATPNGMAACRKA